jgi:hypothetical protein
MIFCFLPPFLHPSPHRWYQVWPAPLFPLLCGRSSEWSDLTINTESKWKVLQYSLTATWTCDHCGSHLSSSSGTPLIIIPQERVSNSFLVAVRYCSGQEEPETWSRRSGAHK